MRKCRMTLWLLIIAGVMASAIPLRAGLLFYAVANDMISGNSGILKFNADGSYAPWDITWDSEVVLDDPRGIARDAAGNVYLNDSEFIYKITPSGQGTTFAVKPSASYAYGVTVDLQGNVYSVGAAGGAYGIYKYNAGGDLLDTWSYGGSLSNLVLGPDGALYSADVFSETVYRIDPNTGVPSVFAAVPGAGDIAFAPNGTLYVGSYEAVYQVIDGVVSEALTQRVDTVYGLAVDAHGNLYIGNVSCGCEGESHNEILLHLPGSGSYSIFASLTDEQTITGIVMAPEAIPEPYTVSLLFAGGVLLIIYRRSKSRFTVRLEE